MAYSAAGDEGASCKVCVLFAKIDSNPGGVHSFGMFVKSPMDKYKKAVELCKDREKKSYHVGAKTDAEYFVRWYNDRTRMDLRNVADKGRKEQAVESREKLRPILKIVVLCGRQDEV